MSTTATVSQSLKQVANRGDANTVADVLRKAQLGNMLAPTKLVKTGLTAATSFDITSAALGSNGAIGSILSLRVTAGAAAAGARIIADAGGTASSTVALVSDDGKTITFEGNVTAFVLVYTPRSAVDPAAAFAPGA